MLSVIVYPQDSKIVILPVKDNSKEPIFYGVLTLKETTRGARPARFRIRREDKEELRAPDELIDLLRLADKILFAEGNEKSEEGFKQILEAYQLDYGYTNPCRICLIEGKYTVLDKNSISYHKEKICIECAKSELKKEAGFHKLGALGLERLIRTLIKTKDLDRVLGMLTPENLDSGLTRFDTLKASKTEKKFMVKDLPVHGKLKNILLGGLAELLPVQTLSIEAGLLDGKNQLIVSATATGKTLVGELAGINSILNERGKMLFLVPLVALANQKYEQFTKRYSSIAKTSLRVGTTRVGYRTKGIRTTLSSEIVVATYEGIDFILRSGKGQQLGKIGTVVIDEVHMLEDDDRGHRLDGMIARLKFISPNTQFVYLSATVGKPEWLAQKLDAKLIVFEERPVPIERHLVFTPEFTKKRLIEKLARKEYETTSKKGFKGQTIVFTNSRRNCHTIAEGLGIRALPYHAGLSYGERKSVETRFGKGELPVVVTTAALAAGVDFPASQVIFESLAMGIEWLTVREFQQMLGRAGRPDYHDRGIVYLLAEPDKRFGKGESEDEVAFRLLRGEFEHFGVEYEEDEQLEEMLSNIVVARTLPDIRKVNKLLLGAGDTNYLLGKLVEDGFIEKIKGGYAPTKLGRIAASHFLSVEQTFRIKKAVLNNRAPLNIVTDLETLDAVYFSHAARLGEALGTHIPTRVFGAGLDMVFSADGLSRLPENLQRIMLDFATEFLACSCRDAPYCGCPEKKFSARVIELCAEGRSVESVTGELTKSYGVYSYGGDLLNYLDGAVRALEAVELIAGVFGKADVRDKARELRGKMEG